MEDTNFILELIKDIYNGQKEDTINLSKIEKVRQFIFEKLIPLIDRSNLYEDEYTIFEEIKNNFNQWVNIEKKPWLKDDKTIIAFMGKFSAGKSSIINSILGENFLPVDITPTTAIPTYISYAPEISVKVVDNDNKIKKFDIEKFRKISKEIMGDFPLSYIVKHFVIGYDNNALKGKSLLDTPGFGDSCDEHDRNNILEVIKESDVIFWVMDINDGTIPIDSLKILQNYVDDKLFYIIVNKADKKIESEQKQIMSEVKKTLEKRGKDYKDIILYSNRDKKYKEKIQEILKEILKIEKCSFNTEINSHIEKFIKKLSEEILSNKKKQKEAEKDYKSAEDKKNNLFKKSNKAIEELNDLLKNCSSDIWGRRLLDYIEKDLCEKVNISRDSIIEARDLIKEITKKNIDMDKLTEKIEKSENLRKKAFKIKEEFQTIMEEI